MKIITRSILALIIIVIVLVGAFASIDLITSILPGWNTTVFPIFEIQPYLWLWTSLVIIGLYIVKRKGFTDVKPLRYYTYMSFPFIIFSILLHVLNNTAFQAKLHWVITLLAPYMISVLLYLIAHPVLAFKLLQSSKSESKV